LEIASEKEKNTRLFFENDQEPKNIAKKTTHLQKKQLKLKHKIENQNKKIIKKIKKNF
jgi:hypothetical protein